MKRAYEGNGLALRNDGQGITIYGGSFATYFLIGEIPKESIGDLICMVGELPEKGECFIANKAGNQMEMVLGERVNAMMIPELTKKILKVTPLYIERNKRAYAVLQDASLGITLVDAEKVGIVQGCLVDSDNDESLPQGPYFYRGEVEGGNIGGVCWANNRMGYFVQYRYPEEGYEMELLKDLEIHKLWEDQV